MEGDSVLTEALTKICKLQTEDHYSLRHGFSKCTTDGERVAVEKMISRNLFDISVTVTRNIVSSTKLDDELVAFKANCLVIGQEECQKFKDERLEKDIKLFGPITKVKMESCSSLT